MVVFDTSLLREKFVIAETGERAGSAPPVIALSNRMEATFGGQSPGEERENFIIRAQNMHSCIRLAAAIGREVAERGPITFRVTDFDWKHLWADVIKGYEQDWNPDIWCAIYMNGRLLFSDGNRHPFLDVIEQCALQHKGDYADTIPIAERAFQQAGKTVKITYDANVAMLVRLGKDEAKCGIIMRSANRTTTFSFRAVQRADKDKKNETLRAPTLLAVCAAYLEGIQLTFQAGMLNYQFHAQFFEKYSDEYRQRERIIRRIGNLNRAVLQFDRDFEVTYRPEQPDFQRHIKEAERLAAKIFRKDEEGGEQETERSPETTASGGAATERA